jgi:hypothetical protein
MSGPQLEACHGFCSDFGRLAPKIVKSTSVNINAVHLREEVKAVARQYMRDGRPVLLREGFDSAVLDEHFKKLHELADGINKAASYKWRVSAVRKAIPELTSRLEMQAGTGGDAGHSVAEAQLVDAITALVPSAGLSYRQAIHDLADSNRVSFRGPAAELREVLREILDHQAPDTDVTSSPGFKLEKDRLKPTMKQKVRFILKARGQGLSTVELPEKALESVEAIVGGLARSVYNFGSVVTHVASERQAVVHPKRYAEVVLSHLLEL